MNMFTDATGEPLSGANHCIMRFPPGELPKVKACWSVTTYRLDSNLVANPIDRYKRGSYRKGEHARARARQAGMGSRRL